MLNSSPSLPFFEVITNGNTYMTQWTPSVQIIQQTNAHPIAFLDVVYVGTNIGTNAVSKANSTWQYLKEGTPIQINYGQNPYFIYPFLGYIASYKLVRTGSDPGYGGLSMTTVQYTITGTSQVMQSTDNQAWKYTSPSTIAGTLATKNGFRGIIYNYTAAIDYRLQNTSDFKFINQLANEIGFRFYVDNTDLYFINPQEILDRGNNRLTPQFWSNNQPGIYDTIRSFQPIVGTITPDGGVVANRNVVGLNPNTQQLVQASVQPNLTASATSTAPLASTITKYYNTAPAESYYEASQKVQADALNNLYWNTAQSELYGDARVKPNTLVNLTGSALPQNEQGLWLVQGATHNLAKPAPSGNKNTTTYTISAELVRDQIYTATTTAIADTAPVTQPVPAVLVNGYWRSSNLGATIYAT